jgi:hypothetical protein
VPRLRKGIKAAALDGFDYDDWNSPVADAHSRTLTERDFKWRAGMRWVLNFAIGIAVALVAVFIVYCTRQLTHYKFQAIDALIVRELAGTVGGGAAFGAFLAVSLGYGLLASIPVAFVEPAAGSSGIPGKESWPPEQ